MSSPEASGFDDHLTELTEATVAFRATAPVLERWGDHLARHLGRGGRLLVAGNGGSATTAQHLAAELVGRMRGERMPLSAIALSADCAAVTAIGNDYGFQEVFARQVRAHGRADDVLLVMSTSGRSPNLVAAVDAAKQIGMRTWAMTGPEPNPIAGACDEALCCPSPHHQIVQELHLIALHLVCERLDRALPQVLESGPQDDQRREPDDPTAVATRQLLVVVGDTLLDRDILGSVHRVTPDAPALVLDEESTTSRPGGAGLAALLAAGRGFDVALITALAGDSAGALLNELLTGAGIEVYPLPLPGATPEKIRMRGNGQVLLRLDRGGATAYPAGHISRTVLELLQEATAILVSDYGRGVTRHPQLRSALEQTRAPIVWDPHPSGAPPVPGVQLVTPSAAEARTLSGDTGSGSTLAAAQRAGNLLLQRWQAGAIAITVGPDGAIVCHGSPIPLVIPAPAEAPGDACGAGDQFAASAALALAGGALVSEAVQEAVTAASAYVKAGGVNTVLNHGTPPADRPTNINDLLSEVRGRGGTVVATGGCFDLLHVGHLATLQTARSLGDCLIVCLNSDDSVRGIKGPGRPLTPQADRSRILAALDCVDAVVIFDEPNPETILSWLRPDIWVKGGDYTDLPEANLIRHWGGQAVTVPYVDGRSTTHTIAVARRDRSNELDPH